MKEFEGSNEDSPRPGTCLNTLIEARKVARLPRLAQNSNR